MKPIIGISGSILAIENDGVFSGYERAYVNDDYVLSVTRAGGIPFIIPMIDDDDDIKAQIANVDGIVLSGGYDIDPIYWGEEVNSKLGRIFPRRDNHELKIIKYALEMKKPILGICRGCQIINVAFGGSLYQDLSFIKDCYIKHSQSAKPYEPTHNITTKEGSIIREIVGDSLRVNSFHHLAIKDLGKGLIATSHSTDGIVESVEYTENGNFVFGVQFHPEMMHSHYDFALNIFKKLISVCKR
ncbi:gamma-glutamyl-gamma-aminobutyrate hydrolase family protein [Brachyspira pilosicoli]|uniref:gamma-glutamyl-gamma-aminobutyrate hydrolase n=2 Tax=Brachyspira pilosicoli TaxID=52584 RepID=D8IFA6_BRAP9|nr:gamma-glutamyl-gamma-aminobutyrate hydrolase family protein [Brachyspira pilosicoli]ADK31829.1 putative glutamine amidotransferase [Brachyspira pilosicoli 95/1000]CCG56214.1 putative glutamine amidotransferase [Brachyspira pilosicoli WesB]